jgi:type IV pilus assembly protein PilM
MMRLGMKNNVVVGLDIETGSVAATAVELNGSARVSAAGVAPLEPGAVDDGEVLDGELLASTLGKLFSKHKLPKDVRIGVANQRLAMRILRMPLIEDPEELDTAVRFQVQDELPMPLDQAVLDFQRVGESSAEDGSRQIDIAVVAARRDMVTAFVGAARRAGLRPTGIDLSAFALIRALTSGAGGAASETTLYCNLGDFANLAVAHGKACGFARVAPFGLEETARGLAERQGLTIDHAREWLAHVGLERAIEEIDGDPATVTAARDAVEHGAAKLADELRLSLDFYSNREGAPPVEKVVFSGAGIAIAGLVERLGSGLGIPFTTARPGALAHFGDESAARLTVAYGLALED